jgi:hypothetical protein
MTGGLLLIFEGAKVGFCQQEITPKKGFRPDFF